MIKRMEQWKTLCTDRQGSDQFNWWLGQHEPFMRARVACCRLCPSTKRNRRSHQAQRSIIDSTGAGLSAAGAARGSHDRSQRGRSVRLAYFLDSQPGVEEQQMLEAGTVDDLLHLSHDFLAREVEIIRLRSKIANEAQTEMDKAQRDYVLRQQMKAIQKELGEDEGGEQAEAAQLRERLAKADLPDEVRKEAERELSRMEKLPAMAPDYHVIRTYLDFILELPGKHHRQTLDLNEAQKFWMRITDAQGCEGTHPQFLASLNCGPTPESNCFVGAPAWASCWAVRRARDGSQIRAAVRAECDEAELRVTSTYVGAMPGRIIQSIRRAGLTTR